MPRLHLCCSYKHWRRSGRILQSSQHPSEILQMQVERPFLSLGNILDFLENDSKSRWWLRRGYPRLIFIQSDFVKTDAWLSHGGQWELWKMQLIYQPSHHQPLKWSAPYTSTFFSLFLCKTSGSTLWSLPFSFLYCRRRYLLPGILTCGRDLAKARAGHSRMTSPPRQAPESWTVYSLLAYLCFVMGLRRNYLPPAPLLSKELKSSWIVTCSWGGASNCLLGQITLFLVVKGHGRGRGCRVKLPT